MYEQSRSYLHFLCFAWWHLGRRFPNLSFFLPKCCLVTSKEAENSFHFCRTKPCFLPPRRENPIRQGKEIAQRFASANNFDSHEFVRGDAIIFKAFKGYSRTLGLSPESVHANGFARICSLFLHIAQMICANNATKQRIGCAPDPEVFAICTKTISNYTLIKSREKSLMSLIFLRIEFSPPPPPWTSLARNPICNQTSDGNSS